MPASRATRDELWSKVDELKKRHEAAKDAKSPFLDDISKALESAVTAYKKATFVAASETIAALEKARNDLERLQTG